jgi:hypothetical protein
MMRYRIQFFDMANVVVLEITIEAENKQAAISKAKSIWKFENKSVKCYTV